MSRDIRLRFLGPSLEPYTKPMGEDLLHSYSEKSLVADGKLTDRIWSRFFAGELVTASIRGGDLELKNSINQGRKSYFSCIWQILFWSVM